MRQQPIHHDPGAGASPSSAGQPLPPDTDHAVAESLQRFAVARDSGKIKGTFKISQFDCASDLDSGSNPAPYSLSAHTRTSPASIDFDVNDVRAAADGAVQNSKHRKA